MKVAIVGGSPSGMKAPFDDDEWSIWVLGNQLDRYDPEKVDQIFEIHDDLSEHGDSMQYANWLVSHNIPMIVGKDFPVDGENITRFDFDAANELMGEHLTSTAAYMMAQAILDDISHIAIYGVDMAVDDHEYFYQRPAMYAWIAYAKAVGIDVEIVEESTLFSDPHVEGRGSGGKPEYQQPPFTETEFGAMAKTHSERIDDLRQQQDALGVLINTHDGAKQVYERLAKVARGTEAGQSITSLAQTAVVRGNK